MALSQLIGPAEISSDNRGVVQALRNDEVHRIVVGYKDVDFFKDGAAYAEKVA